MIVKPYPDASTTTDPRQAAGANAERQMAHYLHRAFAEDQSVFVLHDLRISDPEQPEHNGQPGVAQIDHLVVHRLGMFIVESKSVSGTITVKPDGQGGDQWMRGREGMPSPVLQARRQAELLRVFLHRHRAQLLGKQPIGIRTVMKLVAGSDQRGFTNMPIQVIVAISDNGDIRQQGGWKPQQEPFRTYLCKADTVPDHIRRELGEHRAAAPLLAESRGAYGVWSMQADEAKAVAEFLAASHETRSRQPVSAPARAKEKQERDPYPTPPLPPQSAVPNGPVCKHCGSDSLTPLWGPHGYYWKCSPCTKNTAMPTTCSVCGAQGERGKGVRIRKDGPAYHRDCAACGISERIW